MLMMKTIEFFHCLFKKRAHHKIEGLYLLKPVKILVLQNIHNIDCGSLSAIKLKSICFT